VCTRLRLHAQVLAAALQLAPTLQLLRAHAHLPAFSFTRALMLRRLRSSSRLPRVGFAACASAFGFTRWSLPRPLSRIQFEIADLQPKLGRISGLRKPNLIASSLPIKPASIIMTDAPE
jgi:hypothetical protein